MKFLAICFLGGLAVSSLLIGVALGSIFNLVVGGSAAFCACALVLSDALDKR